MTILVFDGAEVPSNRILLVNQGAKALSVSFWRLRKRGLPKTKPYLLSEKLPDNVAVFIDSGWRQACEAAISKSEMEEYAADYDDFIANNLDRISGATELLVPSIMGMQWVLDQRVAHSEIMDEVIYPVWTHDQGQGSLFSLAAVYENIAIPNDSIEQDTTLAPRINAITRQHGTRFHGISIAKPDNLRSIPFTTVTTMSWLSPMMRGETIVWDGTRLVRYPKRMKAQARIRYRAVAEKAGLDFEKILADDNQEITRLAIWSYMQLEDSMDKKNPFTIIQGGDDEADSQSTTNPQLSTNSAFVDDPGNAETLGVDVDNRGLEVRNNSNRIPITREPSEVLPMPVFGFDYKTVVDTDEEGRQVLKNVPVVSSQATSMRQCNTCFVASNCPAMKPNTTCAFNLPVEVKTKDQLRSLLNTIIEMQGQRVAFSRFAEEMNGGYPDPNTSQEIDRLFKLVKTLKELEDNREFIRITAERSTAGGILSAVFGDRAQSLRELPNNGFDENQTNKIIDNTLFEDI